MTTNLQKNTSKRWPRVLIVLLSIVLLCGLFVWRFAPSNDNTVVLYDSGSGGFISAYPEDDTPE